MSMSPDPKRPQRTKKNDSKASPDLQTNEESRVEAGDSRTPRENDLSEANTNSTPPSEEEQVTRTANGENINSSSDPGTLGDYRTVAPQAIDDVNQNWKEGQLLADRFRVIRCIGQGGMGKVYLTQDEILGRKIALKRVPQEIIFDGDARDDLRRETNRLLDLAHENIIRVHTYYDEPAWPFFAMEFLEGPTLKELLRERKKEERSFEIEELTLMMEQVGKGLSYAHSKGLVHRDLKPANLMLARPIVGSQIGEDDTLKITDFGISRVVADSTLRNTGVRSGTLPYMSPEQFRGEECTVRSDIYSLGVTFYELIYGKPPYSSGDIGYQILNIEAKNIQSAPKWLNQVLARALAKNPNERYESPEEFVEAFQKKTPYPNGFSLGRFIRKHARTAALILIFTLLLTGGLTLDWSQIWRAITDPEALNSAWNSSQPGDYYLQEEDVDNLALVIDRELRQAEFAKKFTHKTDSFTFELSMLESQINIDKRLFNNVIFELISEDDPEADNVPIYGVVRKENGKEVALQFVMGSIPDGLYRIQPLINPKSSFGNPQTYDGKSNQNLLQQKRIHRKFEIDTTPPEFEVRPTLSEIELVYSKEGETDSFVTFNPECILSLNTPNEAGDIAFAQYQERTTTEWAGGGEITEPKRWRISQLKEGVNRFKVIVADEIGNQKEKLITVERLKIEIQRFDREKLLGNEVIVAGSLAIDADSLANLPQKPTLVFYVNGEPVGDLGDNYSPPALLSGDGAFSARLTLDSFENSIEVRYRIGRGTPQPFTPVRKIDTLKLEKPVLKIVGFPDDGKIIRTQYNSLKISGELAPYYPGMSLDLEQKGLGSPSSIDLTPKLKEELAEGEEPSASFDEEILLEPNETNEIVFRAYFDGGTSLWETPKTYRVFYDNEPPALYNGIEFDIYNGAMLHVLLDPTEDLNTAKVRISETDSPWGHASLKDEGKYLFMTKMPMKNVLFEVELEDAAGNTAYFKKLFISPFSEGEEINDPTHITRVEGQPEKANKAPDANIEPASYKKESNRPLPKREDYVATIPRIEFLKDHNLEFRPFGPYFEEMATTELPEKIWNVFLHDIGILNTDEGSLKRPMVMDGDLKMVTIKQFETWMTEKCGEEDGYEYFIPNPDQWKRAFVGTREVGEATNGIVKWFIDKNGFKGSKFTPLTDEKYALNRISKIRSRQENMTPTGLFDMESNLQELAVDGNDYYVIGGFNRLRTNRLREACIKERAFIHTLSDKNSLIEFTGIRLCRRPKQKPAED